MQIFRDEDRPPVAGVAEGNATKAEPLSIHVPGRDRLQRGVEGGHVAERDHWRGVGDRATALDVAVEIVEVGLELGMGRATIHPVPKTSTENLIWRKGRAFARMSWYHSCKSVKDI